MKEMYSSRGRLLKPIILKSPKPISLTRTPATITQPPNQPLVYMPVIDEFVRKFKSCSKRIRFRRRLDFFDNAVRRLAAGKHFSQIESILEHQKKYPDSMSQETFGSKLVSLYGKAAMFDHAYKLFHELPQYGCPRTVVTFNALLYACVQCNKIEQVTEFFHELPQKLGIQPNVVSYNTVIEGFCASNDLDSAMEWLEKMEESPFAPDSVTYNTIFKVYYKENKFEEAEKLWQRMEEKGVVANVNTYNARLRSLIRNDQVQEAFALVEKMVNEEVKPDMYSYDLVIAECVSRGKLEEAKILHSKMVGGNCIPGHKTFGMLVSFACDKGDADYAFELTKHSFELKTYVNRQLMQLVVDALTGRSMIKEAKELVALVNSSEEHRYKIFL